MLGRRYVCPVGAVQSVTPVEASRVTVQPVWVFIRWW